MKHRLLFEFPFYWKFVLALCSVCLTFTKADPSLDAEQNFELFCLAEASNGDVFTCFLTEAGKSVCRGVLAPQTSWREMQLDRSFYQLTCNEQYAS